MIAIIAAAFSGGHGDGPHTGGGWDHKAVASEGQAAKFVGGWRDDATKKLYRQGIQHLTNQHQKPGSFTIGQVVDQEGARESQRATATQHLKEVAKSAKQDAAYKKAYAELHSGEQASNQLFGFSMYRGYKADDLGVHIIVDGNHYEYMSQQDQHQFNHLAVGLWSLALRNLYGYDVPFERRRVIVENLAGDELYHDVVDQPTSRER